ncbi:S1 family peptidase [Longispora albida]|uniref:S1 family peptidase n=1 Tax=Longispora albida TaxID=203523 RepID=UPI0003767A6D|nr:serine protease [Longispora albida]
MNRRLVSTLLAAATGAVLAATTLATPASAAPTAVSFAGTVALSNCSGSIVRAPHSLSSDPALVMSNGHCLESGMPGPGVVVVNQSSTRSFTVLSSSGRSLGTVRATKVSYGTMTSTDVAIYQTNRTYAQIQSQFGVAPLTLANTHPTAGTAMSVVSGYWKRMYNCNVDGFAYKLREAGWTFNDSIRYTSACKTIGGTSGSPIVEVSTGKVIGVNNTRNESGGQCTLNNPCEVDQAGNITVRSGIGYGQQTYIIVPCIGTLSQIDLARPGCTLPR